MPIFRGVNKVTKKGYYQYGPTGKKYEYVIGDKKSRLEAVEKCKAQRKAIKTSQHKVYDFPG